MGKKMSNKNPKPVELHIFEGNPNHRTKEQLEEKAARQYHIGDLDFTPTGKILQDADAKKCWDDITGMIVESGADFITTFDTALLEDLCLSHAEKERLIKTKQEILSEAKEKGFSKTKLFAYIDELGLQVSINREVDQSMRLRKLLGVDPLSRLNALKKRSEPKKDAGDKYEQEFGGV